MNPPLRLRLLTRADLPFADSLRAQAGWNQTLADWELFLRLEPAGCFLAEWGGQPVGTATTIIYGTERAWIGMMLVHPAYRCRGIGRALLIHCLEYLHGRGVRCIKLDATPLGKKLYVSLGFQEEGTLTRWQREPGDAPKTDQRPDLRTWINADAAAIESFDAAAFGVSRRTLVPLLAKEGRSALVLETERDHIAAYGFLRNGSHAFYLGPLVAKSPECGNLLTDALVELGHDRKIFWDIPDQNIAGMSRARHHGFTAQRGLTRMVHGDDPAPGDPQRQFAIAGPEMG